MSIAPFKSKSYNFLKLNFEQNKHCQAEMTEKRTSHLTHAVINEQIAYVCETDQLAEFHIVLTLNNLATLNFGAF